MYYVVMSIYGEHDCLWLNMHTTNDPATFVYKSKSWNKVMHGPSKGNVYSNDYVYFMEVKGDKISRFTEYFNPEVTLASFDGKLENQDLAPGSCGRTAGRIPGSVSRYRQSVGDAVRLVGSPCLPARQEGGETRGQAAPSNGGGRDPRTLPGPRRQELAAYS